jgi:hypothetical protein
MDIKQIEHREAIRLSENHEKKMLIIEERARLSRENHEKEMLIIEERGRLSREKHDEIMMKYKIQIQEILASIPKRKIYFGKVKTE